MRNQWKILIAFFVAMAMALAMGLSPAAADLVDDPVPEAGDPSNPASYSDVAAYSSQAGVVYDVHQGNTITSPMCRIGYTTPPSTTVQYYYIKHEVVWQSAKTTANNTPVHRKLKEYITVLNSNGDPVNVGNSFQTNVKVDGVSKTKGSLNSWQGSPGSSPYLIYYSSAASGHYLAGAPYWSGQSISSTYSMTDWYLRSREIKAQLWILVAHPTMMVTAASSVPPSWPTGVPLQYAYSHGGCYSSTLSVWGT